MAPPRTFREWATAWKRFSHLRLTYLRGAAGGVFEGL